MISSRMITSHQVCSSWNKVNFENVENVLKLTVDKFCLKVSKFQEQQDCLFVLINSYVTPQLLCV